MDNMNNKILKLLKFFYNLTIFISGIFFFICETENERIIRANDPVFNSKFHYAVCIYILTIIFPEIIFIFFYKKIFSRKII